MNAAEVKEVFEAILPNEAQRGADVIGGGYGVSGAAKEAGCLAIVAGDTG
jgi:hypothetical protein